MFSSSSDPFLPLEHFDQGSNNLLPHVAFHRCCVCIYNPGHSTLAPDQGHRRSTLKQAFVREWQAHIVVPWLLVWRAHFVGIKLFDLLLASSSNPNYIHGGRVLPASSECALARFSLLQANANLPDKKLKMCRAERSEPNIQPRRP